MKAPLLLAALSCTVLMGCETMQHHITAEEDLLSAAGFSVKPANTSERQEALKRLPANKFVTRMKDDHVVFVYADPVVCNCLYVGDQEAYNAYKRYVFQQHLADQQALTAQMYSQPWSWGGWDWGPWGWGPRFWWW